jgi:acyl-coenzyme A synthetase/AMP-(fatty) acid ligase
MYGMEMSVLLPLLGGMAVHSGKPLFAADIADALVEVPEPRVLVSTPVHLRALLASGLALPRVALVVSATAPLDPALAVQVERALGAEVLEVFGSTETCVIAHRRTSIEAEWSLYAGVELQREPDGTRVHAPWIPPGQSLQDVVELLPGRRFALRGRNVDMVEIAGKRASLADLTRRLLAVPGVHDAVIFQPDGAGPVRRVAALVVAPGLAPEAIAARLRESIDPAFLPRPLKLVDKLPRNETGKLPHAELVKLL